MEKAMSGEALKALKLKEDIAAICNYILDEPEYDDFLESLNDNGALALTDEELDVLLENPDEHEDLLAKECKHPEQNHIYALAFRVHCEV